MAVITDTVAQFKYLKYWSSLVRTLPITKKNKRAVVTKAPKKIARRNASWTWDVMIEVLSSIMCSVSYIKHRPSTWNLQGTPSTISKGKERERGSSHVHNTLSSEVLRRVAHSSLV